MKNLLLTIFASSLLVTSCGPAIYKSQEFDRALARHKVVAILPAAVTMQLRPNEAKKMTTDQVTDLEQKTAFDIQDKMYSWFLRRSEKYNYTVTFQDISRTNALLKQSNLNYGDIVSVDRAQLAKILGVDAVIQNRTQMDKPMSTGAAVALGAVFGVWGNTNHVTTTISIHDGQSGNLLWKYDYEASGSVGSSTDGLINALMRNASKKFPYRAS
ncbi:MAG TPA: hypothetical protein VKR32_04990 [Puia sp.]|nr:hypothetical protein [Puia sp.]